MIREFEKRAMYAPLEEKHFNSDTFFRLVKKQREREDVAALHYAKSLEILLCRSVKGQVSVGSNNYVVKEKDVFFMAPNVVHSTVFEPGSGEIYVFQIAFEYLNLYLDIERIFKTKGGTVFDIPCRLSEFFDEIYDIIFHSIYQKRDNKFESLAGICKLFALLSECRKDEEGVVDASDEKIRQIIAWTKEHYTEDITIEQIASEVFLSKYYFCRYFKDHTGITYMHYLNELRICKAIDMMKKGADATTSCFACGFNNLSFFIKKFKEITGYTTAEYKKILLSYPEGKADEYK